MKIRELIEEIKNLPNCIVYPSKGLPKVESKHYLPEDIKEFYELCGGITLFENQSYIANIVSPDEFILANPIIVGELCEEDITSEWYIIANDGNGDYMTIDLNPERMGRCYDSYWDRHGVVGECDVIAITFTDLLQRLVKNSGQRWYWLRDDFASMGDAYDGIPME